MEQPKRPLSGEPGRRYTAGRVPARDPAMYRANPNTPAVSNDRPKPVLDSHLEEIRPKAVDGIAKPPKKRSISRAKPALPRPHRSLVLKRHMVERADQHRKQVRRDNKKHFASMIVALVVISALAVIVWVFWDSFPVLKRVSIPFINNHPQQVNTPEMNLAQRASNLDQNKPSDGEVQTYQTSADAPRLLRIPKLDIEARVKRVGSSLSGEPISPNNIFDVGWYDDSSKPGQPGAVLINGHVRGSTKNGVFHDLNTLQVNDTIDVEKGDKTVIHYVVSKVQLFTGDQVDINTALQSISAEKNGLNLLTSSASYDGGTAQSAQRVIVFAVQK